ncbi:carboxypeptidase [Alsobacter metallidurans]|uniref:Carboxypeptidase n=1 Tax=Alsobacter metallidurans TaxID=340221 RepID=A0A917I8Y8_9HYPH|nr:M20 family metallopeptidase [Alsobacter metallidurans]GGH21477.1 carboxypeptidase [Alsobacter metallidurans]
MSSFDLDAMLAGISRWVAIESPTSDAAGVNRMIDTVAQDVEGLPIAIERIPGKDGLGDSIVLRAGPQTDRAGILVMSHVDTVHPLGTLAKDLPIRREGDKLFGPGIYDMKGGAYLALEAFKRAASAGAAQPLTFLFTPDEEIGSPTTRGLIEELGRKASAVLVTEPARDNGKIVTARKGVGRFDVHVEGRPAHSGSRHPDGRSAIREAARQILAIEAMTDYARGVTTTVGMMAGGTAANVIPQHARFSVDLRVVEPADGEEFKARILGLAPHDPDCRITVVGDMNRPPYKKTADVESLYQKARALAAEIGMDLQDVPQTGGGSDGNFTAALGVPTLDGLGIDGDGAHTLHEHALVSSVVPRAQLMERLLTRLS